MPRRFAILFAIILAFLASGVALQSASAQTPSQQPAQTNIGMISAEATGWLQGLIRINTTNPPGNELSAAKYVAGILQQNGIPSEIFESTPGRGILIARLSSSAVPDPSRALLLMAHLDVVGVDRSKWQVDPFGAIIQNGYLYGRGAIDDKSTVIANTAVLVALKRANVRLNRDVIMLAEGDEEQGGEFGVQFAIKNYWEKIAAGFAINEEGRVIVKDGKVQYVGVQAAEKVPVNVTVISGGTSGHASVPLADNAVVHLAGAISKIADYQTPFQLTPVTEAYFEQLSLAVDPDTGKWMRALDMSSRADLAEKKISEASPIWNSMMRDTISPTMLNAGVRANVIPSEARATLNVRLLPGNSIEALLAKLRQVVNDPRISFETDTSIGESAPSSSLDSDLYKTITQASNEEFPGAVVVPMMSTGATDSAFLRLRNVQAYGLLPFPLAEEDILRMHADNERIPVASFQKGIEFLYRIVSDFAVSK
ncbi:MAG TPA: M20/M25/M40 family metallo-hydrolase [Candidatus Acidoferrales bacterium]|nr:M20/M25/M40 family metallo-hydrolase [Candidatus Acidoferrales bacterium]